MPNPDRLRCPECGTRRTDPRAMAKHRLQCLRPVCHCMWATYPHRPGSIKTCDYHPLAGMFRALLNGASKEEAEDVFIDIVLNTSGTGRVGEPCPF